jgi:hypothetical protein
MVLWPVGASSPMIGQLVSSQPPPRLTCLHDAMSKSSARPPGYRRGEPAGSASDLERDRPAAHRRDRMNERGQIQSLAHRHKPVIARRTAQQRRSATPPNKAVTSAAPTGASTALCVQSPARATAHRQRERLRRSARPRVAGRPPCRPSLPEPYVSTHLIAATYTTRWGRHPAARARTSRHTQPGKSCATRRYQRVDGH